MLHEFSQVLNLCLAFRADPVWLFQGCLIVLGDADLACALIVGRSKRPEWLEGRSSRYDMLTHLG